MTSSNRDTVKRRPMLCGSEVPDASHICAFFDSSAEQYSSLAPFFTDALELGDCIVNVVEESNRANHLLALAAANVPVEESIASDHFRLSSCEDTYERNGKLDLESVLSMLRETLEATQREGQALRTCGEMTWIARDPSVIDTVLDYEARVNELLPRGDCTMICLYDLSRMPAGITSDILATHPYALVNGRLRENPNFVPPADYLAMLRARR